MRRFVVVSGCSGGGKSTLVAALAARGFSTVAEPGRRIVEAALNGDGRGLPWEDPLGFAERALALATTDWQRAQSLPGPVIFDRGLIDAVAAFEHLTGHLPPEADTLRGSYAPCVALTPPWPAIYQTDTGGKHSLTNAQSEYHRLLAFLPRFGYRPVILGRLPLDRRVAHLARHLPRLTE